MKEIDRRTLTRALKDILPQTNYFSHILFLKCVQKLKRGGRSKCKSVIYIEIGNASPPEGAL